MLPVPKEETSSFASIDSIDAEAPGANETPIGTPEGSSDFFWELIQQAGLRDSDYEPASHQRPS